MSDGFLKALLDKMPPWFYQIAGVVILLALVYFFWLSFSVVRNLKSAISNVLGRDDRIKELQTKVDELREESVNNKEIASLVSRTLFNTIPYIELLNGIRVIDNLDQRMFESLNLIQRMLDSLASDMKTEAGGSHRCGVWFADNSSLKLVFASSGFPKSYINTRSLLIDRSLAGKCFRRRITEHVDDVTKNSDWSPNPESKNPYTSLICISLNDYGVLTIDGVDPMPTECVNVASLYAAIIEGVIQEHMLSIFEKQKKTVDISTAVG